MGLFSLDADEGFSLLDPRRGPYDQLVRRPTREASAEIEGAELAAIEESKRQGQITAEQYAPYREAGLRGLENYADLIGQQGDYAFRTDIPDAYQSGQGVPQFGFESAEMGYGQGNVPQNFQFGADEYQNYRDPGQDFRSSEALRGLDRRLAARGKRRAGIRPRALMEMGQDLESQEFRRSRGRALQDYNMNRGLEAQRYGQGVGSYNRGQALEAERYGRERDLYGSQLDREQTLEDRRFIDYGSRLDQYETQRARDLGAYARQYTDPMSRQAQLGGRGQATTFGLADLRSQEANTISGNMRNIGNAQAAGTLAGGRATSTALGALGSAFGYQTPQYGVQPGVAGDANYPAQLQTDTSGTNTFLAGGYGGTSDYTGSKYNP